MIDEVRAWLNGSRKYDDGVRLYKLHGDDPMLKREFGRGETPTSRSKLFQALKSLLLPSNKSADNVKKVAQNANKIADKANDLPLSATPAVEFIPTNPIAVAAKREADTLYKEMMNTRAQMFLLCPLEEDPLENNPGTMEARGRLAMRVVELQPMVDKAYADFRYAEINGKLPDGKPVAPVIDPVKLYQEISNLRKNLSRIRKKEQTAAVLSSLQEKEQRLEVLLKAYADATK